MELRHWPPADAPAATDPGGPPDDREWRRADSPRADSGQVHRTVADAGPARDAADRYNADAEFKRGIPKPPGYLPDDTGRLSTRSGAARPIELHHNERSPTEIPRPREAREADQGDTPRVLVDRPAFRDPFDRDSPDRYGDPLTRPDGTRTPCFGGQPRREQATQGWPGDCGLIAALGSVAAHRPDDITSRVRPESDGTYTVTLSEAHRTECGAAPTGHSVDLSVTPDLPVYDTDPTTPACAMSEDETAWSAVMEKALAGMDQTWTTERRVTWLDGWASLCAEDQADGGQNPRSGPAPEGYVRLSQGTNPWERAEVLTQLTGEESVVRQFPSGAEEWRINRIIRTQLEDSKPVLVSSRSKAHGQESLPHGLEPAHVYEVTGVDKGRIVLRNPWNYKHPQPMETDEFARNMQPWYVTLT